MADKIECGDAKITFMGMDFEPHDYEEVEVIHNVCIQILRCRKCGDISIGWYREEENNGNDKQT